MAGPNDKLRVLRRIPDIRFDEELRGYNKHQVDRVLENLAPLADEVDALIERLGEAERRAVAAEARLVEHSGSASVVEAPAPAPEPVPAPSSENFDETLSKTLLLAQRTADATVAQANEEASRITSAAESEAASLRAEVEAERSTALEGARSEASALVDAARLRIDERVAEAEAELEQSHGARRDALVQQIAELDTARQALADDIERFEGHLAARRATIKEALTGLSGLVEEGGLAPQMPPSPSPVADADEIVGDEPDVLVAAMEGLHREVGIEESVDHEPTSTDPTPSAEVPVVDDPSPADEVALAAAGFADPAPTPAPVPESIAADAAEATVADPAVAPASPPPTAVDGVIGTDEADPFAVAGDPTEAVPVVEAAAAPPPPPAPPTEAELAAGDRPADPAWMEPAPEQPATSDPFLDELRRVTSDDDAEVDDALESFMNDPDDDDQRGGWFGRKK